MSRQFRFYLLPSQLEELVTDLRQEIGFGIVAARSATQNPKKLTSVIETANESFSGITVTSVHCYLVPPFEAPLLSRYAPPMKDWFINSDDSEVIQISGGRYTGQELGICRFYFQTDRLNEKKDAILPHRDVFLKWGEQIFRAAKRRLRYSSDLAAYVDEKSEQWRQEGGKFLGV